MRARLPVLYLLFASLAFAAPQWIKLQSPHFTVLSDGDPADARTIADQLERLRWAFLQAYPSLKFDASAPTEVFAVRNKKELLEAAPASMQGKGQLDWSGVYLGSRYRDYMLLRLDAADAPGSYDPIYESYALALENAASQVMPPWLGIGLAEFWGATEIQGNTVALGRIRRGDMEILGNRQLVPLTTLLNAKQDDAAREHWDTGSVYYAESWALVHYLIMTGRESRTNPLGAYLALLKRYQQAGVPPDSLTAASAAFGNLDLLQQHLAQYLRRPVLEMMKLETADARIDKKRFAIAPLPAADADAARAEMLAIGGRSGDARTLLQSVLRDAPQDPAALEAMGLLEIQANDSAAALAWFSKGAAADPNNAMVQYEYAVLAMQSAHGALDDAAAAKIEASLKTALRLEPDFAPALDALVQWDFEEDQNLPAAAGLAQRATALAPGNFHFAYDYAMVLARLGRGSEAKAMLNSALALARDPGETQRAQQMLQQLSAAQTDASSHSAAPRSEPPLPPVEAITTDPDPRPIPSGAHKHLLGEIAAVRCPSVTAMDLDLRTGAGIVTFHTDDFFTVAFAATNFQPSGTLNPCQSLVGYAARVEYVVPAQPGAPGIIVAIVLTKK